jgi:hypothetical protein
MGNLWRHENGTMPCAVYEGPRLYTVALCSFEDGVTACPSRENASLIDLSCTIGCTVHESKE